MFYLNYLSEIDKSVIAAYKMLINMNTQYISPYQSFMYLSFTLLQNTLEIPELKKICK